MEPARTDEILSRLDGLLKRLDRLLELLTDLIEERKEPRATTTTPLSRKWNRAWGKLGGYYYCGAPPVRLTSGSVKETRKGFNPERLTG